MTLKSERTAIAAPMSYVGSAQRLWWLGADAHPAWRWGVLVPLLLAAIVLAWTAVTVWYLTFGLLVVPYRLIRRGSRKRKLAARKHRELLEAIGHSNGRGRHRA